MEMLKAASNICEVKKEVEKISKKPFEELKEKASDMFVEQVLLAFAGAKSNASGQVIDGVNVEVIPIVVFGHKDNYNSKQVNNFHNLWLNETLQLVLNNLVSSHEMVLYSFASVVMGIYGNFEEESGSDIIF